MFNAARAGNLGGTTGQSYGIQFANVQAGSLICGADMTNNSTAQLNIIAGLANLTLLGMVPTGNILLPFGGITVGTPVGGASLGGINVAADVSKNGTVYTNP